MVRSHPVLFQKHQLSGVVWKTYAKPKKKKKHTHKFIKVHKKWITGSQEDKVGGACQGGCKVGWDGYEVESWATKQCTTSIQFSSCVHKNKPRNTQDSVRLQLISIFPYNFETTITLLQSQLTEMLPSLFQICLSSQLTLSS